MRKFVILAGVAALALNACTPAPRPAELVVWTPDTRAVLTGDAALALTRQCSRVSPGPVTAQWTPDDAMLDALESELIIMLARELDALGESGSLAFYRQYAGFIIGGRRVIYVNGLAALLIEEGRPFDWRTQAANICDGGPLTFGVEYNVARRGFDNFAFNGAPS